MKVGLRYLTTLLVLLAIALGYALTQGPAARPAPERPASAVAAPRIPPPRPLPSARELLDRGAMLSLSAEQQRRLEALERAWAVESAGLETELQAATAEFSRFMSEAQAKRGASPQEIQRRSADIRELSAELREQRRRHGEAAAQNLANWQRRRLAPTGPDASGGTR